MSKTCPRCGGEGGSYSAGGVKWALPELAWRDPVRLIDAMVVSLESAVARLRLAHKEEETEILKAWIENAEKLIVRGKRYVRAETEHHFKDA